MPTIESVISGLQNLEAQLKILKMRRDQLTSEIDRHTDVCPTPEEISQLVAKHILEFKALFNSAPLEQQKQLIRQWVKRIEICEERGQKKAQVTLRTLPQTPEFQDIQEKLCYSGPCRT